VYEGGLYLAATDGYRLAEKRVMDVSTDIAAIVPSSTLQEVLRTIHEGDETVEVLFDDIQVRFRVGDNEITSKLIDGNFPDYRQLIPKTNEVTAEIDKQELARIVKIAALFARDSGGAITLAVNAEKQELSVHSIASEVGENSSTIKIKDTTADGNITLNARYITDMLSVIPSKFVVLEFSGSLAPSVFRPLDKDSSYTHIIMPIKS
jgi:DNA polymerase-3 subunit beta